MIKQLALFFVLFSSTMAFALSTPVESSNTTSHDFGSPITQGAAVADKTFTFQRGASATTDAGSNVVLTSADGAFSLVSATGCAPSVTQLKSTSKCYPKIRFNKASVIGSYSGTLKVGDGVNDATVSLSATVVGAAPVTNLKALENNIEITSSDYGMFQPSATASKIFTIKNNGNAALTLSSALVSSNSNYIKNSDTCAGRSVSAGNTCSIKVTFKASATAPSQDTSKTASVEVSAPGNVTVVVSLSAIEIGQSPANVKFYESSLEISTLDFGTIIIPGSMTKGIILKNTGGAAITASAALSSSGAFSLGSNGCAGVTLNPNASCTVYVRLLSSVSGDHNSSLNFGSFSLSLMGKTRKVFTLTTASISRGTINSSPVGINCGSDCSSAFNEGTSVVLSASLNTGYRIVSWTSPTGCSYSSGSMTCVMTRNISVAAPTLGCAGGYQLSGGSCQPVGENPNLLPPLVSEFTPETMDPESQSILSSHDIYSNYFVDLSNDHILLVGTVVGGDSQSGRILDWNKSTNQVKLVPLSFKRKDFFARKMTHVQVGTAILISERNDENHDIVIQYDSSRAINVPSDGSRGDCFGGYNPCQFDEISGDLAYRIFYIGVMDQMNVYIGGPSGFYRFRPMMPYVNAYDQCHTGANPCKMGEQGVAVGTGAFALLGNTIMIQSGCSGLLSFDLTTHELFGYGGTGMSSMSVQTCAIGAADGKAFFNFGSYGSPPIYARTVTSYEVVLDNTSSPLLIPGTGYEYNPSGMGSEASGSDYPIQGDYILGSHTYFYNENGPNQPAALIHKQGGSYEFMNFNTISGYSKVERVKPVGDNLLITSTTLGHASFDKSLWVHNPTAPFSSTVSPFCGSGSNPCVLGLPGENKIIDSQNHQVIKANDGSLMVSGKVYDFDAQNDSERSKVYKFDANGAFMYERFANPAQGSISGQLCMIHLVSPTDPQEAITILFQTIPAIFTVNSLEDCHAFIELAFGSPIDQIGYDYSVNFMSSFNARESFNPILLSQKNNDGFIYGYGSVTYSLIGSYDVEITKLSGDPSYSVNLNFDPGGNAGQVLDYNQLIGAASGHQILIKFSP